jgi:hypothetical protein
MPHSLKLLVATTTTFILLGLCSACGPHRRANATSAAPAEQPAAKAEKAEEPAAQDEADDAAKKAKEEAKQARERQRKLVRLDHELEVARLRLSRAQLAREHAEAQFAESVSNAETDLELARVRLQDFTEVEVPQRTAWSELSLQRSEDGLKHAREELEQLELMYSEEQFADQTKEIVLERARRQLQRSERDAELRRKDHERLIEVELPLQTIEHERAVQNAERGLAQLRRGRAAEQIDQRVGVLGAEAEIVRLENERTDLMEEIAEAARAQAEQAAAPK